jgi:hypothetical protein
MAETEEGCVEIHIGQNTCGMEFETKVTQGNVGKESMNFKTAFIARNREVAGKSL